MQYLKIAVEVQTERMAIHKMDIAISATVALFTCLFTVLTISEEFYETNKQISLCFNILRTSNLIPLTISLLPH